VGEPNVTYVTDWTREGSYLKKSSAQLSVLSGSAVNPFFLQFPCLLLRKAPNNLPLIRVRNPVSFDVILRLWILNGILIDLLPCLSNRILVDLLTRLLDSSLIKCLRSLIGSQFDIRLFGHLIIGILIRVKSTLLNLILVRLSLARNRAAKHKSHYQQPFHKNSFFPDLL